MIKPSTGRTKRGNGMNWATALGCHPKVESVGHYATPLPSSSRWASCIHSSSSSRKRQSASSHAHSWITRPHVGSGQGGDKSITNSNMAGHFLAWTWNLDLATQMPQAKPAKCLPLSWTELLRARADSSLRSCMTICPIPKQEPGEIMEGFVRLQWT